MTDRDHRAVGLEPVHDFIRSTTGLVIPAARQAQAERALRDAMASAGCASTHEFIEFMRCTPDSFDAMIEKLVIGETYFFRDPAQFEHIRRVLIPELLHTRADGHVLRLWSAGCASGEEAYTLAMLLTEMGLDDRARILGTDISRQVLARARAGRYGNWSLRGCAPWRVDMYFRPDGKGVELRPEVRRRVDFEWQNLAGEDYPRAMPGTAGMDLVLCRNVLIYFDDRTIRNVARRLHEALAPGGFLITGPSDPPLAAAAPFETASTPAGLVYRRSSARIADGGRSMRVHGAWGGGRDSRAEGERSSKTAWPQEQPGPQRPGADEPAGHLPPSAAGMGSGDVGPAATAALETMAGGSGTPPDVPTHKSQGGCDAVQTLAASGTSRYSNVPEVLLAQAMREMTCGHYPDAVGLLRRVLYVNRDLELAEFALGIALERIGDRAGAVRAYRNAQSLAAQRSPSAIVPLSEGARAEELAAAAAKRRQELKARMGLGS